jgi:hypothetical protein
VKARRFLNRLLDQATTVAAVTTTVFASIALIVFMRVVSILMWLLGVQVVRCVLQYRFRWRTQQIVVPVRYDVASELSTIAIIAIGVCLIFDT